MLVKPLLTRGKIQRKPLRSLGPWKLFAIVFKHLQLLICAREVGGFGQLSIVHVVFWVSFDQLFEDFDSLGFPVILDEQ